VALIRQLDGVGFSASQALTTGNTTSPDTAPNTVSGSVVWDGSSFKTAAVASPIPFILFNALNIGDTATRFYWSFEGPPAASTNILYVRKAGGGALFAISQSLDTSIKLRDSLNAAVGGASPVLTTNTTYRIEWYRASGSGSVNVRMYDPANTLVWTINGAVGTTLNVDEIQIGRQGSVIGGPYHYSHIAVSDTAALIGAYASAVNPWVYWNGATETPLVLNGYWDGTTMIPLTGAYSDQTSGRIPWLQPFDSTDFINTSVGDGVTYLPTTDPQHTSLFNGVTPQWNDQDWSDTYWRAVNTDPVVRIADLAFLPSVPAPPTEYAAIATVSDAAETGTYGRKNNYLTYKVPTAALWGWPGGNNKNTDRKVTIVQPDGYTAIVVQKFQRTTDPLVIYCTNSEVTDLRTHGLTDGAIASGISADYGMIRNFEVTNAATDPHSIQHALRGGLPDERLKVGPIWPSRTQDSGAASTYLGYTTYGTFMVLDRSVDVTTLGLSAEGLALAYALQDYGLYILIRAGNGSNTANTGPGVGLQVELTDPSTGASGRMKTDWQTILYSRMRVVTNSVPASGFDANRVPLVPAEIAGGGTRRRPSLPDISTTGPW